MSSASSPAVRFSIIIPCRELSTYLSAETLPALASQTLQLFEVIVLPDTRTVSEERLCTQYPWLRFNHTTYGLRPGIKRDVGAHEAKGDILVFIDDDAWPLANWLEEADRVFSTKPSVYALGGPGMVPPHATMWEQSISAVLVSFLGSGGYSYRFTPLTPRFVDDFPSMNMFVRKDIFFEVGGFQNTYWPGEDSKLLNMLMNKKGTALYYDPSVQVYHHRRSSLMGHLRQYEQYGYHRGRFFTQGDHNSNKFIYAIPSILTAYSCMIVQIVCLQWYFRLLALPLFAALMIPAVVYMLLIAYEGARSIRQTHNPIVGVMVMIIIPMTHMSYGFAFIRGILRETIHRVSV